METPSGAWTGLHLEAQKEEPRNDRIAILPREVCPLPDSQNENFGRSGTAPKNPDWFVGPQGQYGSHGPCSSKPPNCRRAGPCFPLSRFSISLGTCCLDRGRPRSKKIILPHNDNDSDAKRRNKL